jgi:hypothetical protein
MEPEFLALIERHTLREVHAARALSEAQRRMWWGLDVDTACEFVRSHPVSCQVTLFLDRLYMATHGAEAMELQLDMSHYHWLLLRGCEPEERVCVSDWQLRCYGNGAALRPSRPQGASKARL